MAKLDVGMSIFLTTATKTNYSAPPDHVAAKFLIAYNFHGGFALGKGIIKCCLDFAQS